METTPPPQIDFLADSPEAACPIENRMFIGKTANQWMEEAALRPDPKPLWMELWFEGEVCCLFADTNVGKSIYAIQIAAHIAKTQPVLYFDFEMNDKQFQLRYTSPDGDIHQFPANFLRLEFSRNTAAMDSLQSIIDQIELQVIETRAKVLIIDNISWICNRAESGDAAGELMQLLISLKRRCGLSILVLAHTPKRNISSPLTQNSLAGSKRIANFMDSMFAIGLSKNNRPSGRYIKQIKVRNCELKYGENNVIVGELRKEGDNILIAHVATDWERNQLEEPDSDDIERDEARAEIARRLAEGQSYRSISSEMRVSQKTISQVAKKVITAAG